MNFRVWSGLVVSAHFFSPAFCTPSPPPSSPAAEAQRNAEKATFPRVELLLEFTSFVTFGHPPPSSRARDPKVYHLPDHSIKLIGLHPKRSTPCPNKCHPSFLLPSSGILPCVWFLAPVFHSPQTKLSIDRGAHIPVCAQQSCLVICTWFLS